MSKETENIVIDSEKTITESSQSYNDPISYRSSINLFANKRGHDGLEEEDFTEVFTDNDLNFNMKNYETIFEENV